MQYPLLQRKFMSVGNRKAISFVSLFIICIHYLHSVLPYPDSFPFYVILYPYVLLFAYNWLDSTYKGDDGLFLSEIVWPYLILDKVLWIFLLWFCDHIFLQISFWDCVNSLHNNSTFTHFPENFWLHFSLEQNAISFSITGFH